ncbi:MAG: septum formation inhibitor Maf [Proteobacteria bacterium]|nr:septum formation inhibitor Maf [Pseudomonadota bacterium]
MLYLASKSPRRQALLAQLGVPYELLLMREAPGRVADVIEEVLAGEPARHYVERIARTKANVGWERTQKRKLPPHPVLGADTEVVLDDVVFGKPVDAADAAAMLARLAGRTHDVITGVAVRHEDDVVFAMSESRVTFAKMSPAEIKAYVATGEPLDKAGAYAIQGRAAAFVTRIEGSYTGIVGLPLYETSQLLAELAKRVRAR